MTNRNQNPVIGTDKRPSPPVIGGLHPAWISLIRYCREMGFGEISQLKIQDGVPVMAEETTKKVKFI